MTRFFVFASGFRQMNITRAPIIAGNGHQTTYSHRILHYFLRGGIASPAIGSKYMGGHLSD